MDFVRERILAPSSMESTTYSPVEAEKTGRFSQAWSEPGRLISYVMNERGAGVIGGAGGILTNSEDLVSMMISLKSSHYNNSVTLAGTVAPRAP